MANPHSNAPAEPSATHPYLDPTPILTIAPNITVRNYQKRDIEPTAAYGNNKKIAMRMRDRYPHPYTREAAETWINKCKDPAGFIKPGPFDPATIDGTLPAIPTLFCICIDDVAVGGIGLNFMSDVQSRTAELGYLIGEDYWGRGIMSKVVPAFVEWGWRTFDRLVRIEAGVFEGNPASCRLLERAGLRKRERLEKAAYKAGKLIAVDVFEMVREDAE